MKTLNSSLRLHEGTPDATIPSRLLLQQGARPPWLLTPYEADTWVVTDTGAKPDCTIRFAIQLPGGGSLCDHPHLLESIQRIVYGVRTGPLAHVHSGQVQLQIAANLLVLVRWMIANHIPRFADLTSGDIQEYAALSAFGIHHILNAESVLMQHLERLSEAAGFNEHDTPQQRCQKARQVVPCRVGNRNQTVLLRSEVMANAGLDGIGTAGRGNTLFPLLDAFEATCGFYQTPSTKQRMAAQSQDALDAETVSEESVRRSLMSFQYLYEHRRYLDDAIHFMPFAGMSVRREAQRLGKAVVRTKTVPVKQAAVLLERAIRWVLDYGPVLLDLKEEADRLCDVSGANALSSFARYLTGRQWPEGPAQPFPILPGYWHRPQVNDAALDCGTLPRGGMTLPTALAFLMTACAIVILSFTARRAAEVLGAKAGCIEKDDAGKLWMKLFVHKTLQDESTFPVPEVVGASVAVLERLSARARQQTGTPYLFQMNLPGCVDCLGVSNGVPTFRLGQYLRTFGYFVDVPPLDDGSRWTFSPHQFRRIFAILYVWIYSCPDWGALSYHLRHFNPEMTRRYVTDPELGHIIALAQKEHTAQVLANAALGKSQVSGVAGERLRQAAKRLHDRMVQRIQVVPERLLTQRILRFVERAGVSVKALPWGYCAYKADTGTTAPVCNAGGAPAPAQATTSTCHHCAFHMRSADFVPYLQQALQWHKAIEDAPEQPDILRQASRQLVREHAQYLASVTAPEGGVGELP